MKVSSPHFIWSHFDSAVSINTNKRKHFENKEIYRKNLILNDHNIQSGITEAAFAIYASPYSIANVCCHK